MSKNQETLTILVVEDEPLLRLMIVDFLRSSGCGVVGAASGEAAVEVLQLRDGIDVVFTDIQLAGTLDGWDVGETSRATHPTIPVIYTSGAVLVRAPFPAVCSLISLTTRPLFSRLARR